MIDTARLFSLAQKFTYLIDAGYDFPAERIKIVIQDSYLFEYLDAKTIKENFDVSKFSDQELTWLMDQFKPMTTDTVLEDKLRIKTHGVALLVAYTLELISRQV